jgi:hypothetical protein
MVHVISLTLSDPNGDNEVLLEALSIVNARPLMHLRRGRSWLADTYMSAEELQRFLSKHSKDDRISVVELRPYDAQEEARLVG